MAHVRADNRCRRGGYAHIPPSAWGLLKLLMVDALDSGLFIARPHDTRCPSLGGGWENRARGQGAELPPSKPQTWKDVFVSELHGLPGN